MNNYKFTVWFIRFLQLLVTLLILAIIFVPIYRYYHKTTQSLNMEVYPSRIDQYSWFLNHEKISLSTLNDPDIIIIGNESDFDQTFTETLKHKFVIYDHLYSAIDEIPYKRDLLETVSGVTYSGFMGKTYPSLENIDEIPAKIIENYELNTHSKWLFQGEGIILQNGTEIIVLIKGVDYTNTITLEVDGKSIPYWGQFEITNAGQTADVKAIFKLHPTEVGSNRLKAYDIALEFPAMYQMTTPLLMTYYIAGDFSNYQVTVPYYHDSLPQLLSAKGLFELHSLEQSYWQWFYPMISTAIQQHYTMPENQQETNLFYIDETTFYKTSDDTPFFITGVNLGAALPNKTFTEFPMTFDTYYEWFEGIYALNVNTVRIYTLLPPVFYEALYKFNLDHTQAPLYLLQEIWPEENPENKDYLAEDYNDVYHQEIEYVVNAVHGNENIPLRSYRAYGLYQYDVSPYLLGFLVGRELEPDEVESTDLLNEDYHFEGKYLYGLSNASPTENWLAAACDYTLQVASTYQTLPLVGIVSWPTLDPLDHDSEWNDAGDKSLQYNDSTVIDINNIGIHSDQVAGFFGAYHIYPNYPDFMNNDVAYADYQDDQGQFRYGGYLEEFMAQHTKYPAVVAEYGISTSMYTAHFSPDGYNHGGLSETEQAEGIIRMTKAIINEGYGGAIIFEWMDEWSKKTWTTEPYMIPYASNPMWHNIMDPEQNYGLLKFTSTNSTNLKTAYRVPVTLDVNQKLRDGIQRIAYSQDYESIYLTLDFNNMDLTRDYLRLKISTPSERGNVDYWEFYLDINNTDELAPTSPTALYYVNPGYNWSEGHYMATQADLDGYTVLRQLVNNENTTVDGTYTPVKYEILGQFSIGTMDDQQSQIQIDDDQMIIRIPYGLLGISDPTTLKILSDETFNMPTTQDTIATKDIEVIYFELETKDEVIPFEALLNKWTLSETLPQLKSSYEILSKYFSQLKQ